MIKYRDRSELDSHNEATTGRDYMIIYYLFIFKLILLCECWLCN